jgi:hypothetical protein
VGRGAWLHPMVSSLWALSGRSSEEPHNSEFKLGISDHLDGIFVMMGERKHPEYLLT